MENAQNFAAVISSMVLGPSFFDHFSMFSQFSIFPCAHFSIFPCFPIFGVGEGGCFAQIWGWKVFSNIWGWGRGGLLAHFGAGGVGVGFLGLGGVPPL